MQNEIKTSTKKDLEQFIENSSFKKIFLLAGNTSYTKSGKIEFFKQKSSKKESISIHIIFLMILVLSVLILPFDASI